MSTSSEPRYLDALRAVRDALAALESPFMFIGGLAVIAHGVPRYTLDIDATVPGRKVSPERVVEAARRHKLIPRREDAIAFAQTSQVVLLRHEACGVPVDVSLAWMPFEEEALGASRVEGLVRQFCEVLEDTERLDILAQLLRKARLRR